MVTHLATGDQETRRLLARWERLLSLGGPQPSAAGKQPSAFEERLQQLGLDRAGALARLARRTLPVDAPLPSWAEFLREVLDDRTFDRPVVPLEHLGAYTAEEC